MTDLVAELAAQAHGLVPLAEVEAAWAKELERRVAAHERGEVETFAAEDVYAEARRLALS